jgi:hypothetical protein
MTEQRAAVNMRFLRCFAVSPGVAVWKVDDGATKQALGLLAKAAVAIGAVGGVFLEFSEDAAWSAGKTEDQALRAAFEKIGELAGGLGQSVATIGAEIDAASRQATEIFAALADLPSAHPHWVRPQQAAAVKAGSELNVAAGDIHF